MHTSGLAILLVEQYLDFAHRLADDVAVMDGGLVVWSGPAEGRADETVPRMVSV